MPKNSSTKKQAKHSPSNGPTSEPEKPAAKPVKMGSEIDEIFAAAKKRKRLEENKRANTKKKPNAKSHDGLRREKNEKKNSSKENGPIKPASRPRKKTADGLTIYTEEELGFGKADAGGTPLCPFDCNCCF